MSRKSSTSDGRTGVCAALQRGKACLRCRKRKMRCDGAKPACQQCVRAQKGHGCEYDDGKGKTRIQILRETVERLEKRIGELEKSGDSSPSVPLHDPPGESFSSLSSPGRCFFPSGSSSPESDIWLPLPIVNSLVPFTDTGLPFEIASPEPPLELSLMMLDIFAPHQRQCGLDIHLGRLRDSLTLPHSEQRHPCLINAIYLWTCFVSRPDPLCQHEQLFLRRTLEFLSDAIQNVESLVEAVQACCMVSLYFFANGRFTEGSYHSGAAAALAIQCRLHGGILSEPIPWGTDHACLALPPAKSAIEEGERTITFWQVYNVESCWSVVMQKPSVTRDFRHFMEVIHSPRPLSLGDYEAGQKNSAQSFENVRSFLNNPGGITFGYSTADLRTKASAIFERADHLAASWDSRLATSTIFADEIHGMDMTIRNFLGTLVPFHQLGGIRSDDRQSLVVSHTLAHTAIIHLYARFVLSDPLANVKCLHSARECVELVKHILQDDFDFLEPILGPCWYRVAETLTQELKIQETSWSLHTSQIRYEISKVLFAMEALSSRFPFIVALVNKIQSRLSEH